MEGLDWTQIERGAVENFISASGALRSALEKFIAFRERRHKDSCTLHMATVPRNIELASDYAAKAQENAEFWEQLLHALNGEEVLINPTGANPVGWK